MSGALLYLDSSAIVKLVLPEVESDALRRLLEEWSQRITCELAAVEVQRAARRASEDPRVHRRATEVLAGLNLLRIDERVLQIAAATEPTTLRSLDALHLGSALSLDTEIGAMVVYDADLAAAASRAGLEVLAPS